MTAIVGLLCCCDGGPPGGCEECPPVTITWSGSCAYAGICCITTDGLGFTTALNCWTFTANHDTKESPAFDNLCASSAQKVTAFDAPTLDSECVADACIFDASASLGVRLRFRLFRGTEWAIVLEASGDIPSLAPNVNGGTGWSLRWTAPISTCPPADGWTWDEDGSVLPVVGTVTCDPPYDNSGIGVTTFSVGGVTVSAA